MNTLVNLKSQIEDILKQELPGFYTSVKLAVYTPAFKPGKQELLNIRIAASNHEINNVKHQYPQYCAFTLTDGELEFSLAGGMADNGVMLIPDRESPKEKYLAMVRYKIPFRRPQKGKNEAILQAIRKYCQNYKKALILNRERLMYQDIVNYDDLLGI